MKAPSPGSVHPSQVPPRSCPPRLVTSCHPGDYYWSMPAAIDRRQFLQAASASALVSLIPTTAYATSGPTAEPGRVRVAILNEPGFPSMDAPDPRADLIGSALAGLDVTSLTVSDLGERLSRIGTTFSSPPTAAPSRRRRGRHCSTTSAAPATG